MSKTGKDDPAKYQLVGLSTEQEAFLVKCLETCEPAPPFVPVSIACDNKTKRKRVV